MLIKVLRKKWIESSLQILGQRLNSRQIAFFESEDIRQGERNSAHYPASIYSALSLNYRLPLFGFRGGVGIFISDWHQLIPGIEKNIITIIYERKFDRSTGKNKFTEEGNYGEGVFGGFNLFLEM